MKKFGFALSAIAFIAILSAFTLSQNKKDSMPQQTYVWHKYNAAGTAELSPTVSYIGTAAGAKTAFGCTDGTSVNCARAYDIEGNPLSLYVKKSPQ